MEKDGDGAKVTKVDGGGLGATTNLQISSDDKNIIVKALKKIRSENSTSKIKEATDRKNQYKDIYQQELEKVQTTMLAMPESTPEASPGNPNIVFWSEEVYVSEGDSKLDNAAIEFIKAEKELFFKKALFAISSDVIADKEYKLIAEDVKIQDKGLLEYIQEKRGEEMEEAKIIDDVKLGIENKVIEYIELKYE